MKLKIWLLTFVFVSTFAGQAQKALAQTTGQPELPRVFLNTSYPNQTGGDTHQPTTSAQLQSLLAGNALNGKFLKLGDTIELLAGTIYSGSFTLPNITTGTGWIIIRTSNMAGIPAAETRVNPTKHAAAMPKLEIQTDEPAIKFAAGAHHYRLVGLEIRFVGSVTHTSDLVRIGNSSDTSIDLLPSEVVVDRCYIHGHSTANIKRGVGLNGKSSAVIDSYISEFHRNDAESYAIMAWNSPGPFKIVNNYLEGAGENLFFGGVNSIPGVVPSDIEVRRNHLFKPPAWNDPDNPGHWKVKNLLEFKSGQRALIEGNILEHNWREFNWPGEEQKGYAVLIKNTLNVTQDILFTKNIVRHTISGINIAGRIEGVDEKMQRIKFVNNVFDDVNGVEASEEGVFLQITGAADISLDHNTAFHTGKVILFYGEETDRFVFQNNVMRRNTYGVKRDATTEGTVSLEDSTEGTPAYVFLKNIIAGTPPASPYPADNYFPTNFDAQFVNRAGGDYHLSATSPGKGGATDGTDVGADIDALSRATKGVISGVWTDSGSQAVIWTNLVGVAASGNDLTKTSTAGGWNAGAISSQTLPGDGYVQFSTDESNTGKIAGLSNGSATQNYTEIDYAIFLGAANQVRVYENGALKGSFGTYVAGDMFKVAVEAGVVKYYKNDVLFYTSTVAPTYPLLVDTSFNTPGATITDAVIKGIVTWTNLVGVAASGNDLTKTSTVVGWNAGAISSQTLSGDGYVEFSTGENNTGKACGLSHASANQNYTEIDYVILLGTGNFVRVYENGVQKGVFGTYSPGEKYRVAVEGGVVKYYRDGALLYTSTGPAPTYPLLVDTSLHTTGATITGAGIVGAWSD